MSIEQRKIKPPPVSDRRLCFRAGPLLCTSEQYSRVHLVLEGHAWDKGASKPVQQCPGQGVLLSLGAPSGVTVTKDAEMLVGWPRRMKVELALS